MAFDDDAWDGTLAGKRAAVVQAQAGHGPDAPAPPDAAEMRHELLSGRWSLVDRFEHAGRLYLVARCGFAAARDDADLTLRERQVLGHVALGRSNKLAAFELGVSPSTVATHLARGMRKLGLRSRLQVVGLLAVLAARPRG